MFILPYRDHSHKILYREYDFSDAVYESPHPAQMLGLS